MINKKIIIFTDGGARGNPGPAGIGAVLLDGNKNILASVSQYIGETTNNVAEYLALIFALKKAEKFKAEILHVFLDSELVVRQLQGKYKVRDEKLKPLFFQVQEELKNFTQVDFSHVAREKNKQADKLVNEAIDRFLKTKK